MDDQPVGKRTRRSTKNEGVCTDIVRYNSEIAKRVKRGRKSKSNLYEDPQHKTGETRSPIGEVAGTSEQNTFPVGKTIAYNPSVSFEDRDGSYKLKVLAKMGYLDVLSNVVGFGMNRFAYYNDNKWKWSISLRGFPDVLFRATAESVDFQSPRNFTIKTEHLDKVLREYFEKLLNLLPSSFTKYREHYLNCFDRLSCTDIGIPPKVNDCLHQLINMFGGIRTTLEKTVTESLSNCWNIEEDACFSPDISEKIKSCADMYWKNLYGNSAEECCIFLAKTMLCFEFNDNL